MYGYSLRNGLIVAAVSCVVPSTWSRAVYPVCVCVRLYNGVYALSRSVPWVLNYLGYKAGAGHENETTLAVQTS